MSSVEADRRLAFLEARLARAEREIALRPVKPPKGANPLVYTIQIGGGNTLSDGSTAGIKWTAVAPTTVPTLYDPNTSPSCIDGVGWGTLYNGTTSTKVLVAHYTGNGSPFTQALVAGMLPVTNPAKTVSLPLAGDPTQSVTLYVVMAP